ncbi:MAG: spore germination protein [Clostridia bacterium]|nr:spore germination protein [Clostridia bacterium]
MKHAIRNLLQFDLPYRQFELKETEPEGTPSFFAHKKAGKARIAPIEGNLSARLETNRKTLLALFHGEKNTDLICTPFRIGMRVHALAVSLNGMADETKIGDFILRPCHKAQAEDVPKHDRIAYLAESVLTTAETERKSDWQSVADAVTEGRTAVLVDGETEAILCDTRGFVSRPVGAPQNEMTILGPKEAFTENIRTNVTLLRRILKRPDFVCRFRDAGGTNRTKLVVAYLDGTVNLSLRAEVERRLDRIRTNDTLSIGRIEQLIEDYTYLPMPQMLKTERPDRAARAILDGRLVLLVEGCPLAGVLPITLEALMESGEDADMRQPVGTVVRVIRMLGAALSIQLPAYFLALALHHPGQLSSEVLETVIASRAMVFLPLSVEMIFLLIVFQLVREAGLRVPGAIGQAIGIIGGLLLGQAAVSANIVSTVVLIIVALTGLGNFAIPDYSAQVSIAYFRILLCLAATAGGLLGIAVTGLCMGALLCSVKSFGVPFLTPFAPVAKRSGRMIVRGKLNNRAAPSDWSNPERRRV